MSSRRSRKDSSDDYSSRRLDGETDESFEDEDTEVKSPSNTDVMTKHGRIRKKSAKVLEMEEVEELERASHKGGKSKAIAAKKVKKAPEPSITSQLIKLASQSHQNQIETNSIKQRLTSIIAESPKKSRTKKNSPIRSPSDEDVENIIKTEDVKMENTEDYRQDFDDKDVEDIYKTTIKKEVKEEVSLPCNSLLSPKKDTVGATITALQAHLSAPSLNSQVDPEEAARMINKRINQSAILNVQPKVEPPERFVCTAEEIDFMAESDEIDPDIEKSLVIDTPHERHDEKYKKSAKSKTKKLCDATLFENTKPLLSEGNFKAEVDPLNEEHHSTESQSDEYYKDKDDDDEILEEFSDDDELSEDIESMYADSQEMGMRVMTSSEKLLSRKRKIKKPKKMGEGDPNEPKRKRPLTAYMLWANFYRHQLCQETPGMDFAAISRKLGEIWKNLPDKEKINWKKKAKRNANKSSNLINTGTTQSNHSTNSTLIKPFDLIIDNDFTSKSKNKSHDVLPIDCAAHLKLLGEALSIIGNRLQEHQGQIAVQGSLSVLLDSLLCALGPLICVMSEVPELDGCPPGVNATTLDNIAYFMPGIG